MKSSCLFQTCGFGSVYEDTGSFKHALVLLTHHTYKQELWRPCYFTAFHWVYCVNKKHLQNSSWSVSNAIRGNYSIGHKVKSLFYANCISWPAALSLPNSPMFVKLHCKEWCNVLLLMPVYLKVVLSLPSIFFHQVSSSDIYCRDCSRLHRISSTLLSGNLHINMSIRKILFKHSQNQSAGIYVHFWLHMSMNMFVYLFVQCAHVSIKPAHPKHIYNHV